MVATVVVVVVTAVDGITIGIPASEEVVVVGEVEVVRHREGPTTGVELQDFHQREVGRISRITAVLLAKSDMQMLIAMELAVSSSIRERTWRGASRILIVASFGLMRTKSLTSR